MMTSITPMRFLFAILAACVAVLATTSIDSLHAAQSRSAPATSNWEFRNTQMEGRPVFQVVHRTGPSERVTRQVTPDELPIEDRDCELDCRQHPVQGCHGKCLRGGLHVLVFDEPRLTVFLAANTGSGQNFDRVILKLDVGSGELTRVGRTFGAGFADVHLSADGRYLAYRMGENAGAMEGGWNLNVMDTQTGTEQRPVERMYRAERGGDVLVDVLNYEWRDASTIVFTAVTRPAKKKPHDIAPRGKVTQYVYSVADRSLMTARERQLIP